MSEIWIRAYGGTGNLMARAFINLLMVNPIKDPDKNLYTVKVFLMDYDDNPKSTDNFTNDFTELQNLITHYNSLKDMKIEGFAENELILAADDLKEIRRKTFGLKDGTTVSIHSVFGPEKETLIRTCLTCEQINRDVSDGNFGDLASNTILAKPMAESGKFDDTYNGFSSTGTIVFYLGSTDGGVANTLLDRDLDAFIKYCRTNGYPINQTRQYRIYSVRSLPYKKHPKDSDKDIDKKNAERILDQMVSKSMGVIDHIKTKTDYVKQGGQQGDYFLDGLFISGYDVTSSQSFDDTNRDKTKAHTKNQSHMSHGVEMVSALMMFDVLQNKVVPATMGNSAIYAYNAISAPNSDVLTTSDLFSDSDFANKIKVAISLYAFLPEFIRDLKRYCENERSVYSEYGKIFKKMYNAGFLGGGVVNKDQIKRVSEKFSPYINAINDLAEFIYQVQKNTKFGNGDNGNTVIDIFKYGSLEWLVCPAARTPRGTYKYSFEDLLVNANNDEDFMAVLTTILNKPKNDLIELLTDGKSTYDDEKVACKIIEMLFDTIKQYENKIGH